MLTILHVEPSGHESLVQAKRITIEPSVVGENVETRFLHYESESGEIVTIGSGTIYVMNDAGKTVGKYRLFDDLTKPASPMMP